MILKASQRGGAKQLAIHLQRTDDNDHVEIHEVRGFASDNLTEALKEAYAISRGTRCKQFLFSVSLNPPETENVRIDTFENAIDRIEAKNGLNGQPREPPPMKWSDSNYGYSPMRRTYDGKETQA